MVNAWRGVMERWHEKYPQACLLDADGVLLHTHKDIVIVLVALWRVRRRVGLVVLLRALRLLSLLRAAFPRTSAPA